MKDFRQLAWVKSMQEGLAESDEMIRTAALSDGWAIVNHRGQVILDAMHQFYQEAVSEVPPRGAFAIHALGGTGRQEICPGSDIDTGILVENVEENEHFFHHVGGQLRLFAPLVPGLRENLKANAFPDLRDEVHFDLQSLASLLDSVFLAGDRQFDDRVRKVCHQRAAECGLDFIFAINQDLQSYDKLRPHAPGDIGEFHVKNGIGGLRNFQMSMWLYSFERWIPSRQIYDQVWRTRRSDSEGAPTPSVLDAVGVIFSARCWIEQRRAEQKEAHPGKRSPSLLIGIDDMEAFLERFGAEGLTQLNTARATISAYRHETMDRLLEKGVVVPDTDGLVVWGKNGLRMTDDALFKDVTDLFYAIYQAQQRLGLPIDQSVKRAARKNIANALRPDAAFIKLLVAPGSIFPALKDWNDFGVLNRLVPGFGDLAHQLYGPSSRTAALTRAARALQRVRNLEHLAALKHEDADSCEVFFLRQYQDLGPSGRGALRLALLVEEIPQTLFGDEGSYDEWVDRYIDDRLCRMQGLSNPTLRTVRFLILMKRELLRSSELSDHQPVLESWHQRIQDTETRDAADTIRALALFAYAAFDFHNPEGVARERLNKEQWRNVQNLSQNLLHDELGVNGQPFQPHYFDDLGQRIGELLPRRLLTSPHVDNSLKQTYEGTEVLDPQRAHRVIYAFKEVLQTKRPKVDLRYTGDYLRLTLYTWEFPGLFWRVAGALFDEGCAIRSTDLYGIPDPGGKATDGETMIPNERRLIFDVLTFDAPKDAPEGWEDRLVKRIVNRLEKRDESIPDNTAEILKPVMSQLAPRLTDLGGGQMKFSCHSPATNTGVRYAICRLLSEKAGASIESIAPDGTHDWPVPCTNFYIHVNTDLRSVAKALFDDLGDIELFEE